MSKMPIAWHQKNLETTKAFLKRLEEELYRRQREIGDIKGNIYFLEKQINEAIRQKKDGFDQDKFLTKEKHHGN